MSSTHPTLSQSLFSQPKRLAVFTTLLFCAVYLLTRPPPEAAAKWIPTDATRFLGMRKQENVIEHPIPKLMAEAQDKFNTKMSRQSKTLEAAVREYKKRYKRDPPKGFDEWFKFAQENKVKMIDEYDGMMDDLEPFWSLPGAEIRRRAVQVGELPSIDLVRIQHGTVNAINLQNGFEDPEVSARAKGFIAMIEKFQDKLPDMTFAINAKAEGRVLVPWEHKLYPNLTQQDSSGGLESMLGGKFKPDWQGDSNVWEAYRRTCDPSTQARRLFGSLRAQLKEGEVPVDRFEAAGFSSAPGDDFQFAEQVDANFSFCDHPWARFQQGHFFSDWRTIPVLYPVFSPAKANGFSDIVIPSHYYYSPTKRYTYGFDSVNMVVKDTDDNEIPWNKKSNKIFWRGATTGGGSSPPGFLGSYQRHRFIRMASDRSEANRTVVYANPPNTNHYVHSKLPIKELNREIMDTAFTKLVGCAHYPGGCDGMRREHRFADAVLLHEHWKHKYLIDFDGMGYSARLFAFLASDSAVIKATVYREFFSDWIQPWLHFIPLSSSYQEIYNIHAYFSGVSRAVLEAAEAPTSATGIMHKSPSKHDGDAQLRRIGKAGRHWKSTMGRKVDMETYVYRLCLEWARLWADDREAASYKS